MNIERIILQKETGRYRSDIPYRDIPCIEFWAYLLTEEILDVDTVQWYLERTQQAKEGKFIAGGNQMELELENGLVFLRREYDDRNDPAALVAYCELEACKQLFCDWTRVLKEKPEVVTLVQEGNRIFLLW